MNQHLSQLAQGIHLTGNIRTDMESFLVHHSCVRTVGHSMEVAAKARQLAARFGEDEQLAEISGWLHDSSAVIPNDQRISLAKQWGLKVLAEEETVPMIIHQKLSVIIARDIFGVKSEAVLNAIGCHTTLKANATVFDKIVFIADKISWDQEVTPPYLAGVLLALEKSLDRAVLHYLDYLWQRRHALLVIHPWLAEAHQQLSCLV